MLSEELSTANSPLVDLYLKLAQENINIIQVQPAIIAGRESHVDISPSYVELVCLVVEYSLEKADGKVIWPKIAVENRTVYEAVMDAHEIIAEVRSRYANEKKEG